MIIKKYYGYNYKEMNFSSNMNTLGSRNYGTIIRGTNTEEPKNGTQPIQKEIESTIRKGDIAWRESLDKKYTKK